MTKGNGAGNDSGIVVERVGAVGVIAFDRPERRNALDIPMRRAFARAVAEAIGDESVRVIVLTGRGGHFCAGGDIGSMRGAGPMDAEAGRGRMREALVNVTTLWHCEKPVLAAVEGCAYGGGFGLALLADLVVAGEGARFCMSFARVGLVPDSGALYTLPRVVGLQRAKELMFSARELGAREAQAWGIVTEVTPTGQAYARTLAMAEALANGSPAALAMTKSALNGSLSSDWSTMIALEASAQGVAFSSAYHREAVDRFLTKRGARFQWPGKTP